MKQDLLFEIGVEELPASYLKPALDSLVKHISSSLEEKKLSYSGLKTFSTARRLTVLVESLAKKQNDETIKKLGPAKRIAFNPDGTLSQAGQGFVRSAGISPETLEIEKTPKGEYISAIIQLQGEETYNILKRILPEAFRKIKFPKTMYWNSKDITFARPIRWLLCLYGVQVVDFEFNGIRTGRLTFGNVLGKRAEAIELNNISDYAKELKRNFVYSNREERKELIRKQITVLAETVKGKTLQEEELLEEVTDLVEYPTAILTKFSETYLKLPERIIHSTLAKNQKYFPLYSTESQEAAKNHSRLVSYFIFVANNHPDQAENTKAGNERVVKARLDDAVFYFEEDLKKSIDYFNNRLSKMVFHASLGSIKDKVERIGQISHYLAESLKLDNHSRERLSRAASICKFDLATNMIAEKEFTGLQGYIGMNYALLWHEDKEVSAAIEEHYHPLSFTDTLPRSLIGTIISIADKIDTLSSLFALGNIPTGSNDPYALRRAGNGIVRMLYEKDIHLEMPELLAYVYSLVKSAAAKTSSSDDNQEHIEQPAKVLANQKELLLFLRQRTEWLLEQNKLDYDIINSVMFSGFVEITTLKKKVKALQKLRTRDDFEQLVLSYKRVSNIISASELHASQEDKIVSELLSEEAEKDLFLALNETETQVDSLLKLSDYEGLLELFISLKEKIDTFFDKILVNVDDQRLRANRYALLKRIKTLFLHIGDLSLIVIEGEKK